MKTPTKPAIVAAELEQFTRDEDPILQSTRSYQTEMFEESLKRNIIVAVSTVGTNEAPFQTNQQADGHRVGQNTHVSDNYHSSLETDRLDAFVTNSQTVQFLEYERS